jgi:peptidoglycan-N-acetylglucosamine deacetylase
VTGLADYRVSTWEACKTETTMIPMLNINAAVGRQSVKNPCSPLSFQTSIGFFVFILLTVAAPVFGQSQNTGAPPASSSQTPTPSTPEPSTYSSCHVDGPYIAMTFDDGPSPGNTTRLLDILKQRNIKVTFFMIGPNVVAHPEIARRALAGGLDRE